MLGILAETLTGIGVVARVEIFSDPEDREELRYEDYAGLAGTIWAGSIVAAVALMFSEDD